MNNQIQESYIIQQKDPYKIYESGKEYSPWSKILEDKNSFIWETCLETYYPTRNNCNDLSKLDYYMLLFLIEKYASLHDTQLITMCIDALKCLPKLYEGDHICIIHICNTLGCRKLYNSGKLNVKLFRTKEQENVCFPNKEGKLQCVFIDTEVSLKNIFNYESKQIDINTIKNTKIHPKYGYLLE